MFEAERRREVREGETTSDEHGSGRGGGRLSDREKLSVEERKPESLLARTDRETSLGKFRLPRHRPYQMPGQISLMFIICKMKYMYYVGFSFEMRQNQAASYEHKCEFKSISLTVSLRGCPSVAVVATKTNRFLLLSIPIQGDKN